MSDIAEADKDYQEVVTAVRSGLYDGKKIKNLHKSHPALQYRSQWDYSAVDGVLLTFHNWLIVPEAANNIHASRKRLWMPANCTFGRG